MKKLLLLSATVLFLATSCSPQAPQPTENNQIDNIGFIDAPTPIIEESIPLPDKQPKSTQKFAPSAPQMTGAEAIPIPKTEAEQDSQIDQNTIDNIRQDGQIAEHEQKIVNDQNRIGQIETIINTPAPAPVVETPVPAPVPEIVMPSIVKNNNYPNQTTKHLTEGRKSLTLGSFVVSNPDNQEIKKFTVTLSGTLRLQDVLTDLYVKVGNKSTVTKGQPLATNIFEFNFDVLDQSVVQIIASLEASEEVGDITVSLDGVVGQKITIE